MSERRETLSYLTNSYEDPFLAGLCNHQVLTADEEQTCFLRKQQGDEWAQEDLASHNFRMVVNIAKRYTWSGISLSTLFSEGCVALSTSIRDFDLSRGTRLSTLAYRRIQAGIVNFINRRGEEDISLGPDDNLRVKKIYAASDAILTETGQRPDPEAISEKTGIKPEKVAQLLEESVALGVLSLDSPRGQLSSRTLYDYMPDSKSLDPVEELERKNFFETVEAVLNDERLSLIIFCYYYLNCSDERISKMLDGVGTRSNVQNLRTDALRILRQSALMDEQLWY